MSYILLGLMVQVLHAGNPLSGNEIANETIVVEARRNMVIYVEEPVIDNSSEIISSSFDKDSIAGYINSHAMLGTVKNEFGTYEPVAMHTDRIEVYSSETVKYAYDECNYKRDALACAVKNDHYLVRTNININDREVVVRMTLYNSRALIVNSSSHSSREIVKWIKQQAVSSTTSKGQTGIQTRLQDRNCYGVTCDKQPSDQLINLTTTSIDKPKEEEPLRFAMPPKLIDKNIHQASIGLFMGVKLD